ncbi:glycosyltransferase [Natronosalvus vescus]|uniref:glycosyltransferase n=1 Tax=Natronosalvus vescus TaxID=2953881 RepID=UPI002091BC65|nr:glycosyltransferase family 2 protein [Natronosalvus vescus]
MTTTLTTSVIVPAKDEGERLEGTLNSLANQRTVPNEVIVVAIGEETVAVAREHSRVDVVVREDELSGDELSGDELFGDELCEGEVVPNSKSEPRRRDPVPRADGGENSSPTRGPGWARNSGAERATGDVLCFTDADTVVPPTWVGDHSRHYRRPEVVGVGGPLDPLESGLRHRVCFRILSDWWYRVSWLLGFVQQPGSNCSVRRTAFERHGGVRRIAGLPRGYRPLVATSGEW